MEAARVSKRSKLTFASDYAARRPTARDRLTMADTGTSPAMRRRAMEFKAAEARQPHSLQTGRPPNWHGVSRDRRSAETQVVSCAKTHSPGESGGRR